VDLTYTYTPRSQIAAINDQTVPNIDQAFTYDGIGRLTASTGPWGAGTFQYDGLGNIRQRSVATRTVGMSYNAANQLSAHTDTSLAVPAPVSMTALYDGASRRVKQVVGGVTRYSVYDASGTLIEIDEVGGAKTDYIRASGMTLARVAGAAVTWLHHDHLGSAVAGTNASGAVVWRESEQPFGEDWTSAAANDNQAGYTGHVEDAATGLTYMQARYYDPVIGRFLSIDPVGFTARRPSMFNRYAYAGNDPMNAWDPAGMEKVCVTRPGSKTRSCVEVDGDGDGKVKDDDLTDEQVATSKKSYSTFIQRNNGKDISGAGLKEVNDDTGENGEIAVMVRVASQFIGWASGGWGEDQLPVRVITAEMAKEKFGLAALPGPAGRVGLRSKSSGKTRYEYFINPKFAKYLGHAGNVARALIHESLHRTIKMQTSFDHQRIDYEARSLLDEYGLSDDGCSNLGGFLGLGGTPGFGGFPGC
jgi:RHS repeat-associated protein